MPLGWIVKGLKKKKKNTIQLIPTSDFPRRSLLEMSKVSPVAAVSTPPVPLFWSRRLSRILAKRGSCNVTNQWFIRFQWSYYCRQINKRNLRILNVFKQCVFGFGLREKKVYSVHLVTLLFFMAEGIVFSPNILPWVCYYGNTKRKAQQCGSLSKDRWHQWTQRRKTN